jgi:hypothetical protein
MTKTIRAALVAAVSALALVFAGSAFASFTPKLLVKNATTAGASGATITASVAQTDDPTAAVTIYIPNGYQVGTPNPGTKLGDVQATAQAADLGGAILPLTGELDAVDPKNFATQQALCGVTTAAATWDLHLTAAGQTLDVPAYVVATAGSEQALGQFKLQICLPPPDVPQGTPGRAAFGAKLLSATFGASALTPPTTAGEYRWRSLWTPYTPNTGKPNPAGTVEVQSAVRIPTQIRLAVTKKKVFKTATVKGKKVKTLWTAVLVNAIVSENAAPVGDVPVTITVNGKKLGSAKTDTAKGAVHATFLLKKGASVTVAATGVIPDRDPGSPGCTKTFTFPCNDLTVPGATVKASVKVVAFKS